MHAGILPPPSVSRGVIDMPLMATSNDSLFPSGGHAGPSLVPPPPQYSSSGHHSGAADSGAVGGTQRASKHARRMGGQGASAADAQKRIRVDRTQQCPFTVRVRWGSRLDNQPAAHAQALEVLSGLEKPDMGITAWADTQLGDLAARVLSRTQSEAALRERSGITAFDGMHFSIALHVATIGSDGGVSMRHVGRTRVDESGSILRNPNYFQLLGEVGYVAGALLLLEATTGLPEKAPVTIAPYRSHHAGAGLLNGPPPPQYGSNMGVSAPLNTGTILQLPSNLSSAPADDITGPLLPTPQFAPMGVLQP